MIIFLIITNIISIFFVYKFFIDKKFLSIKIKENENIKTEKEELNKTISNLKIIEGEKISLEKTIFEKNNKISQLELELKSIKNNLANIEKEIYLTKQEKQNLIQEKNEWQNEKTKLLKEISYNIIQENIKQNNVLQEKNKQEIETITKNLHQNFSAVLEKVQSLNDDTKKTDIQLDLIKRALLNPTGAGLTSETTLSNILKNSGLKEKQSKEDTGDYILQTSFNTKNFEEDTKRPDAIVYLPNNNYIIIDSKSSKHFLELQQNIDKNNQEEIKEIKKKIKERMNKHLSDLASKDYQKSQIAYLNLKNENNYSIISVMFLQTEQMLQTIREIDPNFETKCEENNIYPLSPIGLVNLLNTAKFTIQKEKQNLNFNNLKEELKQLFNNFGNLFIHSKNLGKSLEKSITEYNSFADVFNKKFILRFKNMQKIGIQTDNNKKLNYDTEKLDTYQLLTQNYNTIDTEAEDISNSLIENNKE